MVCVGFAAVVLVASVVVAVHQVGGKPNHLLWLDGMCLCGRNGLGGEHDNRAEAWLPCHAKVLLHAMHDVGLCGQYPGDSWVT